MGKPPRANKRLANCWWALSKPIASPLHLSEEDAMLGEWLKDILIPYIQDKARTEKAAFAAETPPNR